MALRIARDPRCDFHGAPSAGSEAYSGLRRLFFLSSEATIDQKADLLQGSAMEREHWLLGAGAGADGLSGDGLGGLGARDNAGVDGGDGKNSSIRSSNNSLASIQAILRAYADNSVSTRESDVAPREGAPPAGAESEAGVFTGGSVVQDTNVAHREAIGSTSQLPAAGLQRGGAQSATIGDMMSAGTRLESGQQEEARRSPAAGRGVTQESTPRTSETPDRETESGEGWTEETEMEENHNVLTPDALGTDVVVNLMEEITSRHWSKASALRHALDPRMHIYPRGSQAGLAH